MSPLERYYKIDQLLKDRQIVSFAVFKEKLGMSPASVKRDLEYMRSRFNAPIEYDRQANGYRFGKPRLIETAAGLFRDSKGLRSQNLYAQMLFHAAR